MSSSPRQLRICPQCGKKFGKEPKLERHLLEVHGATLSIPPPTTPPSPSFLLVETQLESALAEANRCFQLGNPSCRLCVHKKPFKNSRDLAQHLVSKHEKQLMCAETVPLPCPPTSSEVSAKPDVRVQLRSNVPHKRVHIEDSLPTDQPQLKKAKVSTPGIPSAAHDLRSAPSECKKLASTSIAPIASVKPTPGADQRTNAAMKFALPTRTATAPGDALTKPALRDKGRASDNHKRVRIDDSPPTNERSQVISPLGDGKNARSNAASSIFAQNVSMKPSVHADRTETPGTGDAKDATAGSAKKLIQRSKSAPIVNHSAALSSNSSSRSGTPSSGSKPPVTPKRSKAVLAPKDSMKKASSPGATTGAKASSIENKTMPIFNPLRGIIHKQTTMMDFSSVGLGSNTRKSYYTLKNS